MEKKSKKELDRAQKRGIKQEKTKNFDG